MLTFVDGIIKPSRDAYERMNLYDLVEQNMLEFNREVVWITVITGNSYPVLKKTAVFNLRGEEIVAFNNIKAALSNNPMIILLNPETKEYQVVILVQTNPCE